MCFLQCAKDDKEKRRNHILQSVNRHYMESILIRRLARKDKLHATETLPEEHCRKLECDADNNTLSV